MSESKDIILAVKCAPQIRILSDIKNAGIGAVKLYLNARILKDLDNIVTLCKRFSFDYAIHSPADSYSMNRLFDLVSKIAAKVVVFHNIYWEDEWENIIQSFRNLEVKLCVENTYNVHEPLKFMRRFGLGRCLDLEHLQLECAGGI